MYKLYSRRASKQNYTIISQQSMTAHSHKYLCYFRVQIDPKSPYTDIVGLIKNARLNIYKNMKFLIQIKKVIINTILLLAN